MAENLSNKKPKATLIKHRKDSEPVRTKKKVVVIKKSKQKPPQTIIPVVSSKKKPDSTVVKAEAENKVQPEKKTDSPKPVVSQQSKASNTEVQHKLVENQKQTEETFQPKPAVVENRSVSFERIGSGKDTLPSPPGNSETRGVQTLEVKRMGGRAGIVAGRRVNGGFQRQGSGQRPQGGTQQARTGGYNRGSRSGHFNRNTSHGRPDPNASKSNRTDSRRPGTGLGGDRSGRIRRHGAGSTASSRTGSTPVPPPPPTANRGKKFYKAKKIYDKHKEQQEKLYQYSKKKQVMQTNPVPKRIDIMEVITVSALARKMNLRASELISKLMGMGVMVTINQQIDAETATILADDYDCKVNIVSLYDETVIESDRDSNSITKQRPPIVTVMGHVDHGKTKLLDAIRDTDVIAGEHGGITQHIGAYMVHRAEGDITFLDTPGHSAFTMMRARGAQITDLVVLVVAANDGVMPRTIEAIEHAKAAESPIIVAINKMDLPDADPDRVKQQLSRYDLIPEEWGGSTQFVEISALKGEGLKELLGTLTLVSEMLELKADWDCRAEGKVIESRVDQGRGVVATVLVENGTLNVGDSFVAGIYHGKVRAMFNDNGVPIQKATPAMPVEILGFSGVPGAGDPFQVTENEKEARQYGSKRQELRKMETARNVKKVTLDSLYDSMQEGELQELKVIIKGDVHGSVEALKNTLEDLSNEEIKLVCIRAAAGAIIEDDVNLASASNAIIVGFHVRPTARALTVAEKLNVEIRKYSVIFEAVADIKAAMEGLLTPDIEDIAIGKVEVRETFKVPKIGTIAGCMVTSGVIRRKSKVNLIRDSVVVHSGNLSSLKRFKDDAQEVKEGYECGIGLDQFSDIQIGDVIEVLEVREISKKLGESGNSE